MKCNLNIIISLILIPNFRPYYRDLDLEDYLNIQVKNKGVEDFKSSKFRKNRGRPKPKTDGEIILAKLKDKTRKILKPVVDKIKNEIPDRLKRGWRKSFGTRRHLADTDLDDTYYYDEEGDEESSDSYDYYNDGNMNGLNVPYYVEDNVIMFPKPKSPKPSVNRIAQTTKDYNYDYNYDYVEGNYPNRVPTTKEAKAENKKFDTSRFYR